MVTWKSMLVSFILASVFSIAFINFIFGIQVLNGVGDNLLNDSSMSAFNDTISTDIIETNRQIDRQENATTEETKEIPVGEINIGSTFGSFNRFAKQLKAFSQATLTLASNQLGIDPGFLLTITGLII